MFMRLCLRWIFIAFSFLITTNLFATDYTFTGNGSWTDPNNWLNGVVPPIGYTLPVGSTITIQGTTVMGATTCTAPCHPDDYLPGNNGTITILAGGSLTLQHLYQFSNAGSVVVYGTLINKTTYENYPGSSLAIYGSVINQGGNLFSGGGTITINSGGLLKNETGLIDNEIGLTKGTTILNSGSTLENTGVATIKLGKFTNNGGTFNNVGTIAGSATVTGNLPNSGTLAPSTSSGTCTVSGDYTATSSAIHNFEIAGATTYDHMVVSGAVNLNGTLNVSLINGYATTPGDNIPIITGTIHGTFSSVVIPSQYSLVYNANSVNLVRSGTPPPPPVPVTDYVFTGNGDWTTASNWQGGIIPPSFLPRGSTITITGNVTIGTEGLGTNLGTVTIASGASASFESIKWVDNEGTINVLGTMIVKAIFEQSGTLNISGTLNNMGSLVNGGTIIVNNGGVINNGNGNRSLIALGNTTINSGGNLINNPPAELIGNATITGSIANGSTLAPGNSPGTYTVNGDYTASAAAVHNFEVAGTTAGAYDVLNVSGTATLNGTLNVTFINGYTKTTDQDIAIINGNIVGTFSTVNVPSSYQVVYNSNNVVLRPVSILPVSFINFEAKKESSGTRLIWNIERQQNVVRYEVQKSTDGILFTSIGSVTATAQNSYSFIDAQIAPKNFYRIKSIDLDGRYQYSSVVQYSEGRSSITFAVLPTVVHNEVVVQHNTASQKSRITILSADGRIVKTVLPALGLQQTTINLATQKAGAYIIRFEDGTGAVESKKIIKQ